MSNLAWAFGTGLGAMFVNLLVHGFTGGFLFVFVMGFILQFCLCTIIDWIAGCGK